MGKSSPALSNVQLEILRSFRHELSDLELQRSRNHIAHFFAEMAMDEAELNEKI